MTWAILKRISFQKKLKKFSLRSYSKKLRLHPPQLFTDLLIKNNFLQTLNENFAKLDTLRKDLYILSDFNINLCQNQNHAGFKSNTLVSVTVSNDVKNYLQFCTVFGLTQIVKSPTRINCSSTLLIDHISASLPELISQEGVINVGLSDHQNSVHLRIARFMLTETLWGK